MIKKLIPFSIGVLIGWIAGYFWGYGDAEMENWHWVDQ